MTFSDKKVVEFVNRHFIPVWESVAPVSVAVFDLGDGKVVRGAYGGNIALYVCDVKGRVLDILPALHPPATTLRWLEGSRALFESTRGLGDGDLERLVASYHAAKATNPEIKPERIRRELMAEMARKSSAPVRRVKPRDAEALDRMVGKAMARVERSDEEAETGRILVVVAGGLKTYTSQIHAFLSQSGLKTPEECKRFVFETVLGEKLEGRRDVFVSDEPVSIAIPAEQ